MKTILIFGILIFLPPQLFAGDKFLTEQLKIPAKDGPHIYSLDSVLIKAKKGADNLIIFVHGAPMTAQAAKSFNLESLLPIAKTFSDMEYSVVIFQRRGFGKSVEPYAEDTGPCDDKDYEKSIRATNRDLEAVTSYFGSRSDVKGIALVGHSAGGFCAIHAVRNPTLKIKGVVSFSGVRGSDGRGNVCDLKDLKESYTVTGKISRIPELWIFSKNDHVFSPNLGRTLWQTFISNGGNAQFWIAPPFEDEGHDLISPDGATLWKKRVSEFLQSIF
jgi:alpha-beta hydrolase superfamily lysophospholipase